jgi:hypothetical protein
MRELDGDQLAQLAVRAEFQFGNVVLFRVSDPMDLEIFRDGRQLHPEPQLAESASCGNRIGKDGKERKPPKAALALAADPCERKMGQMLKEAAEDRSRQTRGGNRKLGLCS